MPFGLWTQVGSRNHVLDGSSDPPCKGAILSGETLSAWQWLAKKEQHQQWNSSSGEMPDQVHFSCRKPCWKATKYYTSCDYPFQSMNFLNTPCIIWTAAHHVIEANIMSLWQPHTCSRRNVTFRTFYSNLLPHAASTQYSNDQCDCNCINIMKTVLTMKHLNIL